MASPVEADKWGLKELTRNLKYALHVLEEETLKQVLTNLTVVKTNRAQCEALANKYLAGLERIVTLVQMVLQLCEAPSSFPQLNGGVESLSLLLRSLAEVDRCMQSGGCYISSWGKMLDSDIGTGSLSKMTFFLLRDFSFSLDLVQAAFNNLMFKPRILQHEIWEDPSESQVQTAVEFYNSPPFELFEWCEERERPVLKQCFLDLGQEVSQHPPLVLEEPSAQPSNSLPLEIDFQDVQNQKHLGQGSYGTVRRCEWHDKDMVVKIIQLDPDEPEFQTRFEMEVSILASLQHPNAVHTFGFGYTEGRAEGFFVMEPMQTDLSKIIKEMRKLSGGSLVFPIDVSMDIMSQIVEGMCALRLQRVIHRDLKPANILVNRPDESMKPLERFYQVKLADFGTSKVRDGLHSVFSTLKVGTPAYMAPEVMSDTLLPERSGEHGYSWKADVYSFGMVCSEILSGQRPFQHLKGSIANTLAAVGRGERPNLPLDCGDPLKMLIDDCWKLNSDERPDVWEVRKRLWECRVYHFFMMKGLSTSWQTFFIRLDSRGETLSRVVSSSSNSGTEEAGDQAAELLLKSWRDPFKVAERLRDVIDVAKSSSSCKSLCPNLAKALKAIKPGVVMIVIKLMIFQRQSLAVQQSVLGEDIIRVKHWLNRLEDLTREAADVVRDCNSTSREFWEIFDNSQLQARIRSLHDNITNLDGSREVGDVLGCIRRTQMPAWWAVSNGREWIQYNADKLHFAVYGPTRSGKFSLINAIRGLRDEDQGAACEAGIKWPCEVPRYPDPRNELPYSRFVWYDFEFDGLWPFCECFVFDFLVLMLGGRRPPFDVRIIKSCLDFHIPVFIVHNMADLRVAEMMRDETHSKPGDEDYNQVYQKKLDEYVKAVRSYYNKLMEVLAEDPEFNAQDRQLLLSQRVYIVSSLTLRMLQTMPSKRGRLPVNRSRIMDEYSLVEDILRASVRRRYRLA